MTSLLRRIIAAYDAIGRIKGAQWIASHFDIDFGDDFDEIQDVFPDAKRAD